MRGGRREMREEGEGGEKEGGLCVGMHESTSHLLHSHIVHVVVPET